MTTVYGYSSSPPPPLDTFNANLLFGGGAPSSPFLGGDEDLDVDASFASSMSISSEHRTAYQSPAASPRSPFVPLPSPRHEAMDISPAYSLKGRSSNQPFKAPSRPPPPPPFLATASSSSLKTLRRTSPPAQRPSFSRVRTESAQQTPVPGELGSSRRASGKAISVNLDSPSRSSGTGPTTVKALGGLMGPPALPSSSSSTSTMMGGKSMLNGGKTRAPLPSQWKTVKTMGGGSELRRGGKLFAPAGPSRRDSEPALPDAALIPSIHRPASQEYLPRSSLDMDVDHETPFLPSIPASPVQVASFGAGDFNDFFTGSPSTAPPYKTTFSRPQSSSPESSPSSKRSSFGSVRSSGGGGNLFDRAFSAGPSSGPLFGGARASTLASRSRNGPYKRPGLSHFSTSNNMDDMSAAPPLSSAYPILSNPLSLANGVAPPAEPKKFSAATFGRGPMRRAYSVSTEQPAAHRLDSSPSGSTSSQFEDSPSQPSVRAQQEYASRHNARLVRLADGSPSFRPAREEDVEGVTRSPMREEAGFHFGGFGSNEKDGKILPCHNTKHDGLMRITSSTLGDLIKGKYASKVSNYHIIDCRYEYEYAGGHIEGAVNLSTDEDVTSYLLTAGQGVHANGSLPQPSTSGDRSTGKQILVFHCEFSKMRGPDMAKKLRNGDRALNQPSYPALYYPEIYILEGGYCEFFKQQPVACNPSAYIAMDDPAHKVQRASDIHITRTRRFDRAQSWQGEVPSSRNSNPLFSNATVRPHSSGAPILALAAASAAQGKRRTGGMMVHEEEENSDLSFSSADGLGSPCAPPRSASLLGPAGSAIGKLKARTALERTASAPLVFGSNLFGKAR